MIKTAAHAAGLSGAAAAAVVSAAELGAVETGGASLAVGASALVGEISATTCIQLRLAYQISVVFDVPFDLNDPEDLLAMFWCAFGVRAWQGGANAVLKGTTRSTAYLGRKLLRNGARSFLQSAAGRMGGQKLARKITEKALLRLCVPGVNIPIAYFANKAFTKKLGRIVIKDARLRAADRRR